MPKTIIKVEDKKKKSNINIGKIKKVIEDNPQAVKKIAEGLGELITNNDVKNTSKKRKATKKTSKSNMAKTIDTISSFLK